MKQHVEQITLEEIAEELKRELAMRGRVYQRWIEIGKLDADTGNLQILKLRACLAFVEAELKKSDAQGDLFQ
ncbi:MAG: hypothetical protein ACR2HT_04205 [Pyrinomonadaceae bacterium]|jgi:hypothetical protein